MSIERNKENCRRFLVDAGLGKHDFSLLADDFTSWTALGGEQPRSAMEAAPARMDKIFKGPIIMHVDGMIGEGNRVAMEAHSEGDLVDGKLYRNTYHFLFEFNDAGTEATSRSYYTVFQQVDDEPLQPIIAGRYHDRFELVDGAWRWAERDYSLVDRVGDLSRHLRTPVPRP